jgi:serpin B
MATMRWLGVAWVAVLAVAVSLPGAGGARAAEPDAAALVKGNSAFAFDLYARLRGRDGNVFFSAYSISNALAMTYAGARGRTATEMAAGLRFPMEGDRLHRSFAAVNRDVNGAGAKGGPSSRSPTRSGPRPASPRAPPSKRRSRISTARPSRRSISSAPPRRRGSRSTRWVEQQTRDRIKDLIPEGVLTPDTRAVLTNAIYFKGKWKHAFPVMATRNDTFTLSTGQTVGDVPLMRQRRSFRYLDGGTFQALELPYDADQQSMIVFLPKRAEGLAELEQALTAARVADWLTQLVTSEVDVTLPRFKITAEFQLKDALIALGMPLAFSRGRADFSGIATGEPLFLSAVVHKAHVEVNEQGTEAAAATGVMVDFLSLSAREPRPVFRADHPFLFVIRDNGSASLLFAGRLVNPQAK